MAEANDSPDFSLSAYDAGLIERIALEAGAEAGLAAVEASRASVLAAVHEAIDAAFTKHFGNLEPGTHIAQHSRIEQFLKFLDTTSKSFWKGIAFAIGKGIALAVVGYVVYQLGKAAT